jgi:pentatricopeptide repeat protein
MLNFVGMKLLVKLNLHKVICFPPISFSFFFKVAAFISAALINQDVDTLAHIPDIKQKERFGVCLSMSIPFDLLVDLYCRTYGPEAALEWLEYHTNYNVTNDNTKTPILINKSNFGVNSRRFPLWLVRYRSSSSSQVRFQTPYSSNRYYIPFKPTIKTYNFILSEAVHSNNLELAHNIMFQLLKKYNISPNLISWSIILHGHVKKGDMDKAQSIFDSLPSIRLVPNRFMYEMLIYGYLNRPQFKRQNSANPIYDGFGPQGSEERDRASLKGIQKASELYQDMISRGFTPGVILVNILMSAHYHRGEYPSVLKLYESMISGRLGHKILPDTANVAVYIGALVGMGRIKEALAEMEKVKPDIYIYSTIMAGMARTSDIDGMKSLYARMREDGIYPNKYIYGILMNGYALIGDVASALDIFESHNYHGHKPCLVMYNTLLKAYGIFGDLNGAAKIFNEMKQKNITIAVTTYNTLIACHLRHGDSNGVKLQLKF